MKWGDAALPAALTLLAVVICAVSFRNAFPLEAMTRMEKEQACWELLFVVAKHVESREKRLAIMNGDYAQKVCATIDLRDSALMR
jgi:hypothetical protein